jgi:hypothetical protein
LRPEYKDTVNDTKMALPQRRRCSPRWCTCCSRSGVGGTLGTAWIAADDTLIAFYTTAFDRLVGSFLGWRDDLLRRWPGLVLSMNSATMDGSRALYGISRDGMTIRQFGMLNKLPGCRRSP